MAVVNERLTTFGDRIYKLRTERNKTLKEVGKDLGMSKQNISLIEQITYLPTLKTALLFADYYNVSLDFLFGRTDNRFVNNEMYYDKKLNEIEHEKSIIKNNEKANNLGEKIRIARLTKGITLAELAKLTGTSRKTISDFEKGKSKPQARTVNRLVKYLKLDV
ncbi:helix-turn-helix domain-containing protein [Clostridium tertium]